MVEVPIRSPLLGEDVGVSGYEHKHKLYVFEDAAMDSDGH